jgi:NDP-sugar pyrophosphorylase family protein
MKAIIIATGISPDLAALNEYYPTGLVPLLNRPFVQYVIEYLVGKGVTDFAFILSYLPEKFEEFIGDGSRWGVHVNYHLCRDETTPYQKLKEVCLNFVEGEQFLLAHADRLPEIQLDSIKKPTLFFNEDGSQWSGWALLGLRTLDGLPKNADEEVLQIHAIKIEKCAIEKSPSMLSVRSYEALFHSQQILMNLKFSGLMPPEEETSEGIWVSKTLTLDSTAKLNAPVWIGENCRIGKDVQLGPNAVIGNDCVIDSKSVISNSIIFSGSYIGEGLELSDSIVDKNRLINTRLGVAVSITDDFILDNLDKNRFKEMLRNYCSRATAIFLLILSSPLLLILMLVFRLTRRQVFYKQEGIKLPTTTDVKSWRTIQILSFSPVAEQAKKDRGLSDLFMRFLPALFNIAKGELHFVGVRPLPKSRVYMLPNDWQSLYLNSKAGFVTESFVLYGSDPTTDEIYSAESFYSVMSSFSYDLKLLLKYLARVTKLSPTPTNKRARLQE